QLVRSSRSSVSSWGESAGMMLLQDGLRRISRSITEKTMDCTRIPQPSYENRTCEIDRRQSRYKWNKRLELGLPRSTMRSAVQKLEIFSDFLCLEYEKSWAEKRPNFAISALKFFKTCGIL